MFRDQPIEEIERNLSNLGVRVEVIKPSKYNILNFVKFYKLIQETQPDIINFHFYPIYSVINYLKLFFDIHIVYTDHMGGRIKKTKIKRILRRVYYNTNSKLFNNGIDEIVCVSNFVRYKYEKEYGIRSDKLCVIYNGINRNRFRERSRSEIEKTKEKYDVTDKFVITCVSLRKDKGAYCLLKAVPKILKSIPEAKFLFIGTGECKEYLKSLSRELGVERQVHFTGIVPDMAEVYSISSCVAMPSIFEEACPFTALESMALGVPVVAFDSGGTKEVVIDGETGYITPRNYEALADKIIKLYQSKNYALLGQNGNNLVHENYSVEICVDKYISLYKCLLN
ncbi:hypothetical protein DU48_06225 [Methanosarcina mazei]|uniref:Glycosyltransferase n=1 Tax=Methanosarcina mazei TaxID=2209 RepID=A0A0F8LGC3_METMZ|nr:hypothetical protein DU44_06255 [Methanosarcina mazei]KKH17772.1 hypothetical protein DU48_06225 [Methanosarcina mazei]KKH24982.1 hypothetical protein DU65_05915 [Methanosarcina mazei]